MEIQNTYWNQDDKRVVGYLLILLTINFPSLQRHKYVGRWLILRLAFMSALYHSCSYRHFPAPRFLSAGLTDSFRPLTHLLFGSSHLPSQFHLCLDLRFLSISPLSIFDFQITHCSVSRLPLLYHFHFGFRISLLISSSVSHLGFRFHFISPFITPSYYLFRLLRSLRLHFFGSISSDILSSTSSVSLLFDFLVSFHLYWLIWY
jgi:hypothetical protein